MTAAGATPSSPSALVDAIAAGFATRIREVDAAYERASSFVRMPVAEGPRTVLDRVAHVVGDPGAASRDLIQRACRTVGVATNAELLARLSRGDSTDAELTEWANVDPIVMWERINELIQVGLARRDLTTGRVGLSAAGVGVAAVLDDLIGAVDRLLSVPKPLGLARSTRGTP